MLFIKQSRKYISKFVKLLFNESNVIWSPLSKKSTRDKYTYKNLENKSTRINYTVSGVPLTLPYVTDLSLI